MHLKIYHLNSQFSPQEFSIVSSVYYLIFFNFLDKKWEYFPSKGILDPPSPALPRSPLHQLMYKKLFSFIMDKKDKFTKKYVYENLYKKQKYLSLKNIKLCLQYLIQ